MERWPSATRKWVKPENIRLTLAFLGDVDIDQIRPLEAAMDQNLGTDHLGGHQ